MVMHSGYVPVESKTRELITLAREGKQWTTEYQKMKKTMEPKRSFVQGRRCVSDDYMDGFFQYNSLDIRGLLKAMLSLEVKKIFSRLLPADIKESDR